MPTKIHYAPEQNVSGLESLSPSAGKPSRFVELARHHRFDLYGPAHIAPVKPVTKYDLKRVHHAGYVDNVFDGTVLNGFECRDARIPESCLWTIGSLYAAARSAIESPVHPQCSPTSGFHHAGYSDGGGFCTFNGLAVVAAKLISEGYAGRVAILDLDFHYGDGTASILKKHPGLSTRVLHRTSGKHFHGNDDPDEFFLWLEEAIADINEFKPTVVLYQAGGDMHIKDPLGGILDDAQMTQRDRSVFRKIRAPIAWNLAGGYRHGTDIFDDPVLQTHLSTLNESNASGLTREEFFK